MAARLVPAAGFVLIALTANPAVAVTEAELSVRIEPDTTSIGIAQCDAWADSEPSVFGTYAGLTSDYELRLLVNTEENQACLHSATCDRDASSGCLCLGETTDSNNLDSSFTPRQLFGSDICDLGNEQQFYFFVQYFKEFDGDDDDQASEPVTLRVDLKAPDKPASPPNGVSNSENALEVRITSPNYYAEDSDAAKLVVCAVPQSAAALPNLDPQSAGVCATFDVGPEAPDQSTKFRIEGLENGVQYALSYALIDEADNLGPFSDAILGTPADVSDFAEYYEQICVESIYEAPKSCASDEQCAGSQTCTQGQCREGRCSIDADCLTGRVCNTLAQNCEYSSQAVADKCESGGGCDSTDLPSSLPLIGLSLLGLLALRRRSV